MARFTVQQIRSFPGNELRAYTVLNTDDYKTAIRAARDQDADKYRSYRVVDRKVNKVIYHNSNLGKSWVYHTSAPSAVMIINTGMCKTAQQFKDFLNLMGGTRPAPIPG